MLGQFLLLNKYELLSRALGLFAHSRQTWVKNNYLLFFLITQFLLGILKILATQPIIIMGMTQGFLEI